MKTKLYTLILLALTLAGSGFAQVSTPLAERQQEFLSWKFGMFLHYGVASYNEGQWATGYEDPGTFAPTQLDCGQWADAAKAAGMKYAVFTTKHTSGYALWDSKHTTHDITAFKNFKDGKGDLVREFVDAFRARRLKVGLYYCLPGDYSKNKLQPGQTDLHGLPPEAAGNYVKFIKLQLTELLTQYGAVDLMWFDQYNNKYTRAQWGEIKAHVHSLQPDCLVLANNSTDFQKTDIYSYEYPWLKAKKLNALPAENNTNAAEVCDCITPGAWFWQTNVTEKSVTSAAAVVDMLKLCNSRQANYLLNVPPDRTGRIPEWLVRRLEEIGQAWQATKPVTFSDVAGFLTKETKDSKFVQSVGGMKVSTKNTALLVECDVSGMKTVTVKPTMVNSALGVRELKHKRDGNTISLTLVTSVIGKGITTSPKPIDLSGCPDGDYSIELLWK